MSLINKMLQDLDARAGQPGVAPLPGDVRPVPPPERRLPWLPVALGGGVALAVAGALSWRMLDEAPAPVTAPAPVAAPAPAAAAPAGVAAPAAAETPAAAGTPPAAGPQEPALAAPPPAAPAPAPVAAAPRAARPAAAAPRRSAPDPAPAAPAEGRTESAQQRAENAYRQALLVLEDGRVTEAIATLQAGLRADPSHDASRQTLVGLLIEAGRTDEAMRQLQAALTLDARQPALAMLLARLQLERGGPAVETLMRTLPYAAGNGEYHAFLAGVLGREGRQREAVEHYRAALRTAPQNGVWWMGLGMALQAEKRDAEALAAFERAQASGTLPDELQAFVARRLGQLGR